LKQYYFENSVVTITEIFATLVGIKMIRNLSMTRASI